jgi:hypothetical protein
MNAFKDNEPELTMLVQELYQQCPTLFETLLPRSEQESLTIIEDDDGIEKT